MVGAGLSGLAAGHLLQSAKRDFVLLEARQRIGGRAFTLDSTSESPATCDLGPSWIWPCQPTVADAIRHFGLQTFPQYSDGQLVFQTVDGSVSMLDQPSPMSGALRIVGGVGRLATCLSEEISPERIRLGHVLKSIHLESQLVVAICQTGDKLVEFKADRLALAIPARLTSELEWSPQLPESAIRTLKATPTWMAGHAKFFATFKSPYWRVNGLCGTASSQCGPLTEIHDASPLSGKRGVLFGFVGLDPVTRLVWGKERIVDAALRQLQQIFGPDEVAESVHFLDWSLEPYTSNDSDRAPQTRHPNYGQKVDVGSVWRDKLNFIVSEFSPQGGGLIEGALYNGREFASIVLEQDSTLQSDSTHVASMGWDWL
ncbi:MAG: FAD-dependent oxidoreductase [Planctomycetota bacterium]